MNFNLIDQPFIPVQTENGATQFWNLRDTLVKSHEILDIADASPLTTFALYRFLLVIVHQCLDRKDWQTIWDGGQLPEEAIEKYLSQNRSRFDLFDAERPFLQRIVEGAPALRPVSDLLAELPTDTNINHSLHTYDDSVSLCLMCCTHGLLRLAPFCGQGGQGKAPSINAPPPVYFLPLGRSLFHTLLLNWASLEVVRGDRPLWEDTHPGEMVGPLEAFTWEPRTTQLRPRESDGTTCTVCRRADGPMVREIVFQKGRDRSGVRVRDWRDPHAAYEEMVEGKPAKRIRTLVPPEPVQNAIASPGFWRQILVVILGNGQPEGDGFHCSSVATARRFRPKDNLRVRVVSLHTRKAKVLHDQTDEWTIPIQEFACTKLLAELKWLGDFIKQFDSEICSLPEIERRAERHFRALLDNTIQREEFRERILADAIELTRPLPQPQRPLESERARRQTEASIRNNFDTQEATS